MSSDAPGGTRLQRIRTIASAVLVTGMLCVFAYGMIRFPDAPIHPCPTHDYCGKQGQAHTVDDYTAFTMWERTLFYLWPTGMVTLLLLRRKRRPV